MWTANIQRFFAIIKISPENYLRPVGWPKMQKYLPSNAKRIYGGYQ
jgi:hypothetical protein